MAKLFELLQRNKPVPGDIGIEIEYEGKECLLKPMKWWKTINDGSLRGVFPDESGEFVINGPVAFNKVGDALKELTEAHKDSKFNFSHRTSVHVHLNVQDMEGPHLLNLIYTYLLLEEPLMAFCGEGRLGNRFCLRLKDAEGLTDTLVNVFNDYRTIVRLAGDSVRYASINLEAIKKYGSVEFRGMRGTMDSSLIMDWVRMIYVLKNYAITKATPKDIHAEVMELGVQKWAKKVLKSLYKRLDEEKVCQGVVQSFSLSYDLPFAYKEIVVAAIAPKPKMIKARVVHLPPEDEWANGVAPLTTQGILPGEAIKIADIEEYYRLLEEDEELAQHFLEDVRWVIRSRRDEVVAPPPIGGHRAVVFDDFLADPQEPLPGIENL